MNKNIIDKICDELNIERENKYNFKSNYIYKPKISKYEPKTSKRERTLLGLVQYEKSVIGTTDYSILRAHAAASR